MNRKRRFDEAQSAEDSVSVPSISEFHSWLPLLNEDLHLANVFEVYSVYSSFLREGYLVDVHDWQQKFYFLTMTKSSEEIVSQKTVIPISASCQCFCLELLKELAGVQRPVFLAWVSHDGAFTVYKVFDGVYRPEEKPKGVSE